MDVLDNPDFVYALGNFMADGCFYGSEGNYRFEFVDGSPYKNELNYSFKHISHIKNIFEKITNKKLPVVRQRENRFVLSFRNKELASLFINSLGIKPGPKDYIVDIPSRYKNTKFERLFWIGYLDGDGSIARKSRRIALESVSSKIIESFANYLKKQGIFFSKYKSKRADHFSYVVLIRSISFRDFANKIGFSHPLKSKLLAEKLKIKDFYISNSEPVYGHLLLKNKLIDYTAIFSDSIFIENGILLLRKYGYSKYHYPNVKLSEIVKIMNQAGKDKVEILREIVHFRFKKSKGSKHSVTLPPIFDNRLLKFAKFIRIKNGSISFSKRYTQSFGENFKVLINDFQEMFDISPKYTSKGELLFCSGVLTDFFNSFITNQSKTIKT